VDRCTLTLCQMEPIDCTFRARFIPVILILFLTTLFVIVSASLISTLLFQQGSSPSLAFGFLVVMVWVFLVVSGTLMLFSQIRLCSISEKINIRLSLFGFTLHRIEQVGVSWHAVASLVSSHEGGGEFTRYRVEVCNLEGERKVILGGFLCWIYGVDCL